MTHTLVVDFAIGVGVLFGLFVLTVIGGVWFSIKEGLYDEAEINDEYHE